MATISTHNGSSVSKKHNERDISVCSKEEHIDLSRVHENWVNEGHREAYDRIFGDALSEYNAKQKRADRRIDDYYDKICADKKKHAVYEMIVGVYDDVTPVSCKREILKKFVDTWSERNPNLEMIGAYYHADEKGKDPHVHIDYIPVAKGCKRGLKTQSALRVALEQQGFSSKTKNVTGQILWERNQNEFLEKLCNERGITVERDMVKRTHLDTDLYKRSMARSMVAEKQLEEQVDKMTNEIVRFEKIDSPKVVSIPLKGRMVSEDDYVDLKNKYSDLKSFVTDFVKQALSTVASRNHENENLKQLNATLERSRLHTRVVKLREENQVLLKKVNQLTSKLKNLTFDLTNITNRYKKVTRDYEKLKIAYNLKVKELDRYHRSGKIDTVPIDKYNSLKQQCLMLQAANDENEIRSSNLVEFMEKNYNYTENEIEEIMTSGMLRHNNTIDNDDYDLEI